MTLTCDTAMDAVREWQRLRALGYPAEAIETEYQRRTGRITVSVPDDLDVAGAQMKLAGVET